MRGFDSSLRWQLQKWIEELDRIDVLVGIPCYNNEDTISHVVSAVGRGLKQHFGDQRCAILISDGGSLDDTRECAYSADIPEGVERRVSIYRGIAGKGTAFRAVFEAARSLNTRTVVVLDSDLRSITPEWLRLLASPVHEGEADFVAPLYRRFKYDGTITNNIVYPLTRALFGVRVAICWEYRVVQVFLGTKIHSPKDPAADLSAMFCQVVSTIFYVAGEMSSRILKVAESQPVDVVGRISRIIPVEPMEVNFQAMDNEFLDGIEQFDPMYKQILEGSNYEQLKEVASAYQANGRPAFSAAHWARVLYDFILVYQVWNRNRRRLVDMLVPLYFGRLAAYCRQVEPLEDFQVEEIVESQAQAFEQEKQYILDRWM